MSILIKGMEMPKERESFTVTIKYNGLVFDTETGIQVAEAQEVPPHGRLIDADEAIGHLFNGEQCLYSWDEIEEAIDATETVIPAEEGET